MSILALRPVVPRDPDETHRAATPLELFFDLVIVIAIAAVTAAFHHAIAEGHGLDKLVNFAFVFVAIWWVWMNFTWFSSGFDNDDALHRLLSLLIMGGATIFAAGVTHIFDTLDFSYALLGWVAMRIGMVLLWLRVARSNCAQARSALIYAAGYAVLQVLWVGLYLIVPAESTLFLPLGIGCFVLEMLVPVIADRRLSLSWHRGHLVERYGLLFIIVLGEALLSATMTFGALYEAHAVDARLISTALAGLILVFAVWWLYFLDTHGHLARRRMREGLVWGYGHVIVFGAVAMMGSGLAAGLDVLSHHAHVAADVPALFVNASAAAFVAMLWVVRDINLPGWRARVVLPVSTLVLVVAAALRLPAEATAFIVVATLVARSKPSQPLPH